MELKKHMLNLKSSKAESSFKVQDIASLLHIHPTHLSNTIKEELKRSPCNIYEEKLMDIAKELILQTDLSIAEIARQLTFDPSNFSKFFKHFEGIITPEELNFLDNHFPEGAFAGTRYAAPQMGMVVK